MKKPAARQILFFPGLLAVVALLLALFTGVVATPQAQAAQSFANSAFERLWNRTDKLVNDGRTSRSFLWGPGANSAGVLEDYADAPGGKRLVQYYDKSRMEITNPGGDQSSAYYVTNGLIAKELMTGQLQLGDAKFEQREAATIGAAGDQDDTSGPTYKALERVDKPAASNDTGILVAGFIDRDGNTYFDRGDYGNKWKVSYAYYEPSTQHNIAGPFWTYLNQTGPVLNQSGQQVNGRIFDPVFFATGLPITEAYWAQVKVAGQVKDVLIQAFERRVLTFTPTNDPAYQVEMGNVGQHYYQWRYANSQPVLAPPPSNTPNPPSGGGGGGNPAPPTVPKPAPTATPTPAPPASGPTTVTFVSVQGGSPGDYASVTVQTSPNASCSIRYIVPSGRESTAQGLDPKTANSSGRVSWSWKIGTNTAPGTGRVIVTCNGVTASTSITISR